MVDKSEFIAEMSGIKCLGLKSLGLKSSGVEMSCNPFKECDLDLDQKDEGDPHNYKPVFTLHSKECTRIDSWCYFCQAYDDLDRPILNGEEGG